MNILYIASVADNRNRLDGESIKNRVLRDFLSSQKDIELRVVDTDNFRKKPIKIACGILKALPWCEKIIISCSDQGAHIVLNFLRRVHSRKKIYYFVIGGRLSERIKNRKWSMKDYENIEKIYVESNILRKELANMGLKNVEVVRNFRKINNFSKKIKTNEDIIRFVFYGRVMKEKGIEKAIRLVNDLNSLDIKCKLDIYGQGKEEYLDKIKKMLNENIVFVGEIKPNGKKEFETLSIYDIFLFPTEYPGECLPGSLIDARIAGLAVLASNWKYAKEFVNDGKDGLIFNYADYEDMRKKAAIMLKNKKYLKMKNSSKERAKEYICEQVLNGPMAEIRKSA